MITSILREGNRVMKVELELQVKSKKRGISVVDYLEHLLRLDSVNKLTLKAFALGFKGSRKELADALGVSTATISKWRGGDVMSCNRTIKSLILLRYEVEVP